jgi:hypothetical protein
LKGVSGQRSLDFIQRNSNQSNNVARRKRKERRRKQQQERWSSGGKSNLGTRESSSLLENIEKRRVRKNY